MSAPSARIGAGFLALVAVWIGVYWLWEPSGAPTVSFADGLDMPTAQPGGAEPRTRPVEPAPVNDAETPEHAAPRAADAGTGESPEGGQATLVPPPFQTYTVQANDTFERISRRFYNTIRHADAVAAANPFVSPTGLRVGQKLRIPNDPDNVQGRPAPGEATDVPVPEFSEYTVVKGDNLSSLAQRFYGSLRFADVIFNANRDTMDNKDDLQIGQVLRIPSRENVLGKQRGGGGG